MKNSQAYKYIDRKILQPLLGFLREGITPHKLSLSVVMGIAFGLIPVFGLTTMFCLLAAFIFKLNKPAVLLINFAIYPLQLILYVPFIHTGELIFGYVPIDLDIYRLIDMFRDDWLLALNQIWFHNLLGIFAWIIILTPVSFFIYYLLRPVFRTYFDNWHGDGDGEKL